MKSFAQEIEDRRILLTNSPTFCEINGRCFKVHRKKWDCFSDLCHIYEETETGLKFIGKVITNDVNYAISTLLAGQK